MARTRINREDLENPKIKVSNMVINGKIPFERYLCLDEINKLIMEGNYGWAVINQETSPMLIARFELDGMNKQKKPRQATITMWHSGSFNLAGTNSLKEAKDCVERVIEELIKFTPRIFVGR